MIVWGEQDRFAGVKMAKRFRQELPGSQLVMFKEAGHFVWDDEPERAAGAVVDFLKSAYDGWPGTSPS